MKKKKISVFKNLNKWILFLTLALSIMGALLILDASSISSVLRYHNSSPYYFFTRQLVMLGIGYVGALIIIKFPTRLYREVSLIFSVICIGIMGVTLGLSPALGNIRTVTITIGSITFQPAEFLKVLLVMYMGVFYGNWVNTIHKTKWSFIIPLIPCALSSILVFGGGDLGTVVVMLALFALVLMVVPARQENDKFFKITKGIGVGCLIAGILFLKFAYLVIPEHVLLSDPRLARLYYVDACDRYEDDSGYQVCNGYIAMNNGGVTGTGIGNSIQKYLYLPESHTDFIFPIIIEEFGILVGIVIIVAYMILLYCVFNIASHTKNLQNSIICYGIGIYFLLHIFVNLGGVLGIIPLTGVPLPFLSYGGSFCVSLIFAFAIVQRINIENKEALQARK